MSFSEANRGTSGGRGIGRVNVVTTTSTNQGFFQCGECKQSYARADHLARHVRCHTQEKPFECALCPKKYSRADLLKRHALSHDETNQQEGRKRQKRQKSPSQFGRVSQACKACAAAKLKCVEEKPCERCVQKNIVCTVERRVSTQPSWSKNNKNTIVTQSSPDAQLSPHSLGHVQVTPNEGDYAMNSLEQSAAENLQQMSSQIPSGMYLETVMANMVTDGSVLVASDPTSGIMNDGTLLTDNPGIVTHLPTPESPNPNIDFRLTEANPNDQFDLENANFFRDMLLPQKALQGNFWGRDMDFSVEDDLQLTDFDFGLLNTYSEVFSSGDMDTFTKSYPMNTIFDDLTSGTFGTETPKPQQARTQSGQFAQGIDAFKKSLWRFNPVRSRDHFGSEQQNLAVNVSEDKLSPHDVAKVVTKMDQVSRDKILCMVLDSCEGSMRDRVVTGFPSPQMLHTLINIYFDSARKRIDTFVHPGTFAPAKTYPPLLACIIASGAACTPLSSVRKLGFAVQEASRIAIPKTFEKDNSSTRDLQVLQAFALQLEIGLWSGNKRKVEIAESHGQPIINMLRRAGKFRRSAYKTIVPTLDDTEEALDQKWRDWAEQESFKRLVFHFFVYDCQVSMAMFVNCVSSYAEFALPFPSSSELWYASDASEWSRIYFSQPQPRVSSEKSTSFLDCIRSFPNLIHPEPTVDLRLAYYVNLHGLWGLIWELRQLSSILKGQSSPNHEAGMLLLTTRHQELCQALQNFRIAFDTSDTDSRLMLELISMMLHVSIEDLQAYAGKEGEEETLRVVPILQQWVQSRESRQAVAFAGQLLKEARSFETGRLRAFHAIAVYHGALTLWAYGILRLEGRVNKQISVTPQENYVWLDGQDHQEIQRFVATGKGLPGIRNSLGDRWIGLENPGATMKVAVHVLKGNRANEDEESVPPLVENLITLMMDLAKAVTVSNA